MEDNADVDVAGELLKLTNTESADKLAPYKVWLGVIEEFLKLEERSAEIFAAISGSGSSSKQEGKGDQEQDEEKMKQRELLLSVIAGSIGVKAHIVTVDERETGLRNLVNF